MTVQRTAQSKDGCKMEARMTSFYPVFCSLWTFAGPSENSVFLAKAVFKYLLSFSQLFTVFYGV
jgi:hypothetical protein